MSLKPQLWFSFSWQVEGRIKSNALVGLSCMVDPDGSSAMSFSGYRVKPHIIIVLVGWAVAGRLSSEDLKALKKRRST